MILHKKVLLEELQDRLMHLEYAHLMNKLVLKEGKLEASELFLRSLLNELLANPPLKIVQRLN